MLIYKGFKELDLVNQNINKRNLAIEISKEL
jgi:hypothetical protein